MNAMGVYCQYNVDSTDLPIKLSAITNIPSYMTIESDFTVYNVNLHCLYKADQLVLILEYVSVCSNLGYNLQVH